MDKVKLALEMLKKYHFWVLCSVAIVVALLSWTWATADLASRYEKREGELDQHFNRVRQILGNPSLRNEGSVEATRGEHAKQKDQVLDGWKILYQQQKENNPLPAVLGDDFRLHFESLQPNQEMHDRFRERYLNFIGRHYPTLLRLVDIYRPSDVPLDEYTDALRDRSGTGGARGGVRRSRGGGAAGLGEEFGMGRPTPPARAGRPGEAVPEADPWQGLVEWPQPEVFDITAGWEQTPTTQQVLLAQEDLWVYEALLRIIASVNAGVETHEKAWIKRIDALEIGRPAAEAWGTHQEPIFAEPAAAADSSAGEGAGAGMGMEGGMGETAPGMGMGAGMGMGEMGGELGGGGMGRQEGVNLLDGRYVDEDGRPLLAQEFETQPPYAEFKMMMVHMNLFMHQRRIPKLLVECANSAMPIKVIRVRINPGEGGPSALGEAEGARGSSRGGRGMGRGPIRPRIVREGGMGGGTAATTQSEDHNYANVEVFGIIYIYNPPDVTKLGTGAAGAEQAEEAEAMQPADQTAPATAPATPAAPATPPVAEPAAEPSPAAPATPEPATPAPATPASGVAPGAPNP